MTPLKYKIIKYEEICEVVELPADKNEWAAFYLESRPNILDDIDIFCKNYRAQDNANFDLFEPSSDNPDVYVFSVYLELFMFTKMGDYIPQCIEHFSKKYPNNLVCFFWNHNNDFSIYNEMVSKHSNVRILNYNTSNKGSNDIILPFWTINTEPYNEPKEYNYGLIATINHPCRESLLNSFTGKQHFLHDVNLKGEDYYKTISKSVYNLCPRGHGLSSWRFFESFHLNTIPVLFTNKIVLPFTDVINYDDISVRFKEEDAGNYNLICDVLHNKDVTKMLKNIEQIREMFTLGGVQTYLHKQLTEG
jgi:hypothetical protein